MKKTDNNQYGVNLQDKEAIKKELERLRKKHRIVTIIAFVIILIMFIPIIDFIQARMGGFLE